MLQLDDAQSRPQAHLQLVLIEGFGQVVVRAGFHPFDQILALALGAQQQDIGVEILVLDVGPHPAANFRSGQARHHPVQDGDFGGVFGLQDAPGLIAVARNHHFIAPAAQSCIQQMPGNDAVVRDQDPHGVKLNYTGAVFRVSSTYRRKGRSTRGLW